ncbi:MAG: SLBB domain-containing protein, partial [Gammaproteobacteria bacterium]|nr:SLBB domain-containing protein [Gammaproteobacteria bacterium]
MVKVAMIGYLPLRRLVPLFASLFGMLLVATAGAQGQGAIPSAEELQMFEGLSPEQQQAILNQLGNNGLGGSEQGFGQLRGGERGGVDQLGRGLQPGSSGMFGLPKKRLDEEDEDQADQPLIPVLKRDDWVIVEIDWQLAPRTVPSYQSLYAAQAQTGNAAALAALQNATPPPAPAAASASNGTTSQSGAGNSGNSSSGMPMTAFQAQQPEDERARLDALMTLIRARNPYRLSHDGALNLPGFPPIPLLGLNEEQATLRLKVEPAFRGLDVRLTRLPLKKVGAEGLKPFGYELFDHPLSTFAPVTNVPVPSDYVVGPGDQLEVQFYGSQNRKLRLFVQRDGHIDLPQIGPIQVGGQTYDQVKNAIESRVPHQLMGVRASVSMGDTRSIRVFVFGEAKFPGSYTISGLGTITSALYAAGGAKRSGSLRRVQLKRRGALIRELDLYDLLIRGDTSDDAKLLQGDVIFIPPVGPTIGIEGEVRRPAIYEFKSESTVSDLLQLAGGLTPEADRSGAVLTRIDEQQHRVVLSLALSGSLKGDGLRNGDLVRVLRLRPTLDAGIVVQGHVYSPGTFAYRPGIRLSDVIHSADELRPNADLHYLLIRRELADKRITVLSADLAAALAEPSAPSDIELMPRDRITVFDLSSGRDAVIQPVLAELRLQGTAQNPTETVHVDGQVKVPGEYPLERGMRISDLVRAGGGPAESAYSNNAELTRYSIAGDETRHAEHIAVDLAAALRGDRVANIELQPFDNLSVKEIPLWEEQEHITLKGEVRFPGTYTIRRGETLKSVILRAGGLTAYAFAEGSVFTREWLRKREQEQLDMLATRMQTDLTAFAISASAVGQGGGPNTLALGQSLLGQIRGAKAVGRMVIDLPRLMRAPQGSEEDVVVRGGDQLIVP